MQRQRILALVAALTPHACRLPICSIELVRHSGRRLRRFSLGECDGGPHEFRGVRRANLLAALAAQLPRLAYLRLDDVAVTGGLPGE